MFKNLKLSAKLIGAIVLVLAMTSGISFWIMHSRINRQADEAFRDKLRQITGMASATRSWFAGNIDVMVPNRNFKHLEQVPVVVAMRTAEQYANKQGMTFRTPSLHPRNPKNQATEFERRALEAFERNSSLAEFAERTMVDGHEVMRYAQPVRVEQDCLQCHGDPAGEKDPFGYPKEGMKAGELRAAFVLEAPTEQLVQQSRSNLISTFLVSFLTVLAAIVVVFYVLRRLVIEPVRRCAEFAATIARKDMQVEDLQISSADEVGDAMVAMNTMKNNLHDIVRSIANTAGHVASASAELSATSEQISANSEEQVNVVSQATQQVSQNLQSVSTGAEEMTSTIQSIASNAHEAATVASNAVQTAQAANATVGKLGESSAEIGEVIKVITSIAQQTNLLALNATIEAARAGEAGKGFAVVANEVKELAKQTAKATEDISRKITAIQTDTKGAVEAIGVISGVISQVNDISSTIATAVEEQSATTHEMMRNVTDAAKGSGEITRNIEGVAEAARGTSARAQESQKAANELAEMAEQLHSLVSQFKIDVSGKEPAPVQAQRSLAARAGH